MWILYTYIWHQGEAIKEKKICCLGKKRKKKVIIHLHGAEFKVFYRDEANDKMKADIRKTLNLADKFIVLSDEWKDFIETIVYSEKSYCFT